MNGKVHIPAGGRWVLAFVGCAAVAASALVVAWPYAGDSFQQMQSRIGLGGGLSQLLNLFEARPPFRYFNLPLLSIAVCAAWLAGILSGGEWITRACRREDWNAEERVAFSFATGFVALGLGIFALGLAGLARPVAQVALLAACAGCAGLRHRQLRLLGAGLPPVFRRPLARHGARNLAAGAILAALVSAALYALSPPVQSDAMRYHLAAPQEFLKNGRIGWLPLNAFSNFPFLPEMHFMLALGCGAPEASQLMHLACLAALLVAVTGFARRTLSGLVPPGRVPSGILVFPATVVVAMPASLIVASWPFVDQAVTLFFFLSFHAVWLALSGGGARNHLLAGVMMGGAAGCKYTALPFLALLAGMAALHWIALAPPPGSSSSKAMNWRHLALGAGLAVLLGGGWYAKSAVLTGNPVYPLANRLFHGGDWTAESAAFYAGKLAEKGRPTGPEPATMTEFAAERVKPLDLSLNWIRYEAQNPGTAVLATMILGMGGLLLCAIRNDWRARPVYHAGLMGAGSWFLWVTTYQSNRMIVPVAVFLSFPAAALLAHGAELLPRFTRAVTLLVGLGLGFGMAWGTAWPMLRANPPVAGWVLGAVSTEEYLARTRNWHAAFEYLNQRVPPTERVLLVGEHRIFGARFRAVWNDWFDTPAFLHLARANRISSAEQMIALLEREGIRWVLVNEAELRPQRDQYWRPRFSDAEWKLLNDFLASPRFTRTEIPPGAVILRLAGNAP